MKTSKITLLVFSLIFMASCATTNRRPLTKSLTIDYGLTEERLKGIQFYLSQEIVLRSVKKYGSSEINRGQVVIEDGSEEDLIIFPEGTPGVLLFQTAEGHLAISFDDSDGYLMFGPNPKANNRYALLAKKWEQHSGLVSYKNATYRVNAQDAYAAILIDVSKKHSRTVNTSRARGRTID